jgi:NAD(P)-dependent dehydrogenase (short-subunit alcohol dehydrogenase family)
MTSGKRFSGKSAVITGAGSGIGRASAVLFAKEGAHVVAADVDEPGLRETAEIIAKEGGRVSRRVADVSDAGQVRGLVDFAMSECGKIDVLVNNAGIIGGFEGLADESPENWKRVLEVNLLGAVMATRFAAPRMMEQREGAVVNVASVAGIRAGAGPNAYSASKAALINFTATSACDLGAFNVRVNAVCPGLIETGMTRPVFEAARAAGKEHKLGGRCELRRFGRPEEVATVIVFLASGEASYVTGQALAVDGGNTASLNMPGMKF